jgi:hypothetical protein
VRRLAVAWLVGLFLLDTATAYASGTLAASPTLAQPGQPILFTVTLTPSAAAPPSATLAFGDGNTVSITTFTAAVTHAYTAPGAYLATLTSGATLLAQISIRVVAAVPRVPTGAIYTVTPTLSPALAGSDIALNVTYSIASPPSAFAVIAPQLEFVVDLLDDRGGLLRRSDPYALPAGVTPGVHVTQIPFSIPVGAAGSYNLRVYVRVASGGTVAVANAIPLVVAGGPDPAPRVQTKVHAHGAIEIGPHAAASGATLDADLTTAANWNTASLALSGLFDPVSRHSDALLEYKSGGFDVSGGREQVSLPAIFGGGEPLRGIDATAHDGPFTYHAAYGYTELTSLGVAQQYASLFDIARTLPRNGSLELTELSSGSDTGTSGALGLQYTQQPIKNLTVLAGGALTPDDSSVQGQLNYANLATSASIQYTDAGAQMLTGGGPGALSDRAAFTSQLQTQLGRYTNFSAGWSSAQSRSQFSRTTDAFAQFTLSPVNFPIVTLSLRRDDQSAGGVSTADNQLAFGIVKAASNWNLSFNGTISALRDLVGAASATTRTGSLQYLRQSGMHALAFGVNAVDVGGMTPTSQVGETLVYGLPLICSSARCVLQLQVEGDNSNTRAAGTGGTDRSLAAILSYHLGPSIAIGLRGETRHHDDLNPALSATAAAVRLRLDLNI